MEIDIFSLIVGILIWELFRTYIQYYVKPGIKKLTEHSKTNANRKPSKQKQNENVTNENNA